MKSSRISLILLATFFLVTLASAAEAARPRYHRAPARVGLQDPRYAALILDPVSGEIFHQHNAGAIRHPASLTKMMTLYLLFEEMKAGKINKHSTMRASRLAASQPQTNISLKHGDLIDVDTAIKSLVVRSANDVAVVVAERISGSVDKFAQLATKRARELGMKNTVFKNPHGLPDGRQITTARDMAKLGIALRRDFPQYYSYFSTRQFSRRGVTYYTHNRVMTGYAGVDGIKTGFINASGFNVVSSVQRGGRRLIGVVLGGTSARWRDGRMKELLSSGYQTLAKRGNAISKRYYAENLPLPRIDMQAIAAAKAAQAAKEAALTKQKEGAPKDAGAAAALASAQNVKAEPALAPSSAAPAQPKIEARTSVPFQRMSAQDKMVHTNLLTGKSDTKELSWGIQVGAFAEKSQALDAVKAAVTLVPTILSSHRPAVMDSGISGGKVHRARIENLSEAQARSACEALIIKNAPCFIYKAQQQKL